MKKRVKENSSVSTAKVPFGTALKKDMSRNWMKYLMVLPVVVWFAIFVYAPMYGITIAFQDYIPSLGFIKSPWVGFEHFTAFFKDVYFWRLLKNTFRISLLALAVGFPASIILALLMNEVRNKPFLKTVQTLTYLPHFISLVVVCGMIKSFLMPNGIIGSIVTAITGDDVSLLLKPAAFPWIYVISNIWQEAGWGSILYLSALSSIDQELYEACAIDGGGRWRQTISITLPGIAPTIIILLIMRIGQILGVGYEKILLLYNEVTWEVADVISTYVYRKGLLDAEFSYSTAVGLFNSIVNVIFIVTANKISAKVTETSLW